MTPLHQAAKHGRAEAVRALIAAGALVESKDVSDHAPPRPPQPPIYPDRCRSCAHAFLLPPALPRPARPAPPRPACNLSRPMSILRARFPARG